MLKNFTGLPSKEKLDAFKGIDILGAPQFTKETLETVMNTAAYYEEKLIAQERLYDMDGKVMAALFFEPSTRTRLSFETAMLRLGGQVITVAEAAGAQISSASKGETLHDTMIINDGYADVIVCRSPQTGAAQIAADAAVIPVINAGDGAGQHPSQALLDIYTIIKEKGSPDGLTVAMIGDLKFGRTVHSLVDFLAMYKCKVVMASPEILAMPKDIVAKMEAKGVAIEYRDNIMDAVKDADVIYMTRVQKERFEDIEEYNAVKDMFIMDGEVVKNFKEGAIIMHPLPRINEITIDVDEYPGAAYFRQARNGLPVRMALLALVSGAVAKGQK